MQFRHAHIFTGKEFSYGSFCVEDGRFAEIPENIAPESTVDLEGAFVIPGLVDIHIHGAAGADLSDGDYEGLKSMAGHLAQRGITSFAPASMTLPYDTLERAYAAAGKLRQEQPEACARLMGIHMEGPFLSEKKKGAQNGAYLQKPDLDVFARLQAGCGGLIRIVDVAPEVEGAEPFIRGASSGCTVSIAHSDASYEDAKCAIQAGVTHLTHLFNAMPPVHHRAPGVIGAASEQDHVTAELICDGHHVHPSAVRMAFRLFPERICLISDALRCCGMPEGAYELGGQTVYLKEGVARLASGDIAGAATDLFDGLRNAVAFGIPMETAIRAATLLPARVIGCDGLIGSIEPGKLADFVVCDRDLNRKAVYLGGRLIEEYL